jgi:hypothetical protein
MSDNSNFPLLASGALVSLFISGTYFGAASGTTATAVLTLGAINQGAIDRSQLVAYGGNIAAIDFAVTGSGYISAVGVVTVNTNTFALNESNVTNLVVLNSSNASNILWNDTVINGNTTIGGNLIAEGPFIKSGPNNVITYPPASGGTIGFNHGTSLYIVDGSATLSSLTISTFPTLSLGTGDTLDFSVLFNVGVTTLTWPSGLLGAALPSTVSAGDIVHFVWQEGYAAWYHVVPV